MGYEEGYPQTVKFQCGFFKTDETHKIVTIVTIFKCVNRPPLYFTLCNHIVFHNFLITPKSRPWTHLRRQSSLN